MYVEIFKIDDIVFIGNVEMHLTSHTTDNFQNQSQFFDTDNITRRVPRKNAQITDNIK